MWWWRVGALLGLQGLFWCLRRGNPRLGDRGLGSSPSSANSLLCNLGLPAAPLWAPFPHL